MSIQNSSQGLVACAYFGMNTKVQKIVRNVGKLDNVLSYIGGLLSVLLGFIGFFLISFNEYRYQLRVAQSTFHSTNPATSNKIKQTDMNFWVYIKYTIYDWVNLLCCCSLKWDQCKAIDQVLDEIKNEMELQRIFRRMQNIDRGMEQLIGEERRICMSLMSLPSLEQSKLKRLINDYYDEINKEGYQKSQSNFNNNSIKPQSFFKQNSIASINNNNNEINLEQTIKPSDDSNPNSSNRILDSHQFLSSQQIQKISPIPISENLQQAEDKILTAFQKLNQKQRELFGNMIPAGIYYRIQKKLEN